MVAKAVLTARDGAVEATLSDVTLLPDVAADRGSFARTSATGRNPACLDLVAP